MDDYNSYEKFKIFVIYWDCYCIGHAWITHMITKQKDLKTQELETLSMRVEKVFFHIQQLVHEFKDEELIQPFGVYVHEFHST